ncbi:MAG TPA: murein transglycosylase A [Hyphomonadaceae bacterium]|nr:murein transglycosylase A [Hyphomonadaceae bacterium]
MKSRAVLALLAATTLAACASSPTPAPIYRPRTPTQPSIHPPVTQPAAPTTPPAVTTPVQPAVPDFYISPSRFSDIPGWAQSDFAPALAAFKRQCAAWRARTPDAPLTGGKYGGTVAAWLPACDQAQTVLPGQEHWFFENWFDPMYVAGSGDQRITAYFEPVIEARRTWEPPYTEPLLSRPSDMLTIDLGAFAEAYDSDVLRGAPRQLTGKMIGDKVEPYPKRAAITPYQGQAFAYAHPADLYNLQVQGSGRLHFPDGTEARAQFSAQNGYKWNSALGALRNSGQLASPTWGNFRAWLDANPQGQKAALNADPSYVFFQEEAVTDPTAGPRGAAGASLTPMGSIAVDPAFHPYGAVVFIDGYYDGAAFDHLFVAQDTGGAIRRGPMRGDVFVGAGPQAGAWAEKMNAPARWWTLVPKTLNLAAPQISSVATIPPG